MSKAYRIKINHNDMGYLVETSEARALELAKIMFSYLRGAHVAVVLWRNRGAS